MHDAEAATIAVEAACVTTTQAAAAAAAVMMPHSWSTTHPVLLLCWALPVPQAVWKVLAICAAAGGVHGWPLRRKPLVGSGVLDRCASVSSTVGPAVCYAC